MIGPFIVVGISTQYTQTSRDMYLPTGTWYNFHTNQVHYHSVGKKFLRFPSL